MSFSINFLIVKQVRVIICIIIEYIITTSFNFNILLKSYLVQY